MATAYTSLLGLALPVTGELSGTWGSTVNTEITALLDSAIAGTTTLSTDADVTLTTTTGAANTSRQAILLCSGARTVLRTITAPAQSKIYTVINATTGGFSVKLVGAGPTTGVTIVAGESAVCAWNGSDFIKISNTAGVGTFTNLTVTGTLGVTGVATLGNGAILGTPASGTVTNLTGTASININGTVGATTASSGAFTTLSATGVTTVQAGTAALPAITTTGDTNTGIFFPAADTIAFSEGGVEAMRIDPSGNVGVGTTSPTTKLTVYDTTTPQVTFDNGTSTFIVGNNAGGNNKILYGTGAHPMIFYTNATEAARIDSNGKLLLGVTSGTGLSNGDFAMANGNHIRFRNAANSAYISAFEFTSANGLNIGTAGSLSTITFGISGLGEAGRFDTSGNLLVGDTTTIGTGGKFQVKSSTDTALFKCTSATTFAAIISNVENTAARLMAFQYGSGGSPTNVGTITTNGTGVTYGTSSDYRLKENIVPMTGALNKVAQLKPVTYKWKINGSDGQGFIAHELAEVVPDAVQGEKDAIDADGNPIYQGIDTSYLVATLTAAIQEQQALITQLTARLDAANL